jgi:pimeloyl-ACP methyl ester carboxylesterase
LGIGYFVSREGRERFMSAYDTALNSLPAPHAVYEVQTSFGRVRAYRFGDAQATPIVLLHGRSGSSPTWQPNIAALAAHYPVFTVDALGEPGASVQTVPIRDGKDQAWWLNETLAELKLDKVHLVGLSMGGWLAVNHCIHAPDRVVSLSLLDPAYVFARFSIQILIGATLAILPFSPRSVRKGFLEKISGGAPISDDDPVAQLIESGIKEFKLAQPTPEYPGASELRAITIPVLALIAGRSAIHNPEHAVQRAKTLLPEAEVELWPDASHAISGECAEQVNARILKFIGKHTI